MNNKEILKKRFYKLENYYLNSIKYSKKYM